MRAAARAGLAAASASARRRRLPAACSTAVADAGAAPSPSPLSSPPPNWLGPAPSSSPHAAAAAAAEDTIVALASGPGPCAIAVIRVAGPATDALLGALCGWRGGRQPRPRTAALVRVRDPATGATLDPAALALRFPGPASYTGGPCGELHVHGGPAVVDAVLRAATAEATARLLVAGAGPSSPVRLAAPGEFTRRAVEAGKLDVASAEGVAALTSAVTEAAREAALPLATGEASAAFEGWRAAALGLLARAEACLEWEDDPGGASVEVAPAEPLGAASMAAVAADAAALASQLEAAVAAGERCEVAAAGARVALLGPANAGKSSLLNALARRPAAIVAPTPGTTRDVVEVALDVGGWGLVVADTAGLRDGGGGGGGGGGPSPSSSASLCPTEVEGIARARAAGVAADVRVVVVDAGAVRDEMAAAGSTAVSPSPPTLAAAAALLGDLSAAAAAAATSTTTTTPCLLVLNKWDLVQEHGAAVRAAAAAAVGNTPAIVPCSAATGEGVPALAAALAAAAAAAAGGSTAALAPADAATRTLPIARARHRTLVSVAAAALRRAAGLVEEAGPQTPPPTELVAEELRGAVDSLGGLRAGRRVGTEEVLGEVFARFCVGK